MNGYIKKQALMDYCSNQVTRTIDLNDIARFPIAEIYTKADVAAMLEELKEQLREMHEDFFETEHFDEAYGVSNSMDIIQQKINKLKEQEDAC